MMRPDDLVIVIPEDLEGVLPTEAATASEEASPAVTPDPEG
jgi:hypothetical protein